jgi:hypothetical protein
MSLSSTKLRYAALGGALVLLLASAAARAADVVEYYHEGLDHYFITGYTPEIRALDGGTQTGWKRTGHMFQVFDGGDSRAAGSMPVCRFYGNPAFGLDSHFYSSSPAECEDVKKKFPDAWRLEADDLFRVHAVNATTGLCPANTKPVYRLYNKRSDVNHRYTTDAGVVDAMLAKGYVLEGNGSPSRPVVFCAANIAPAQPVTGAPVCTLTASTSFPVVGSPVTLTATCTGAPTTYAWINCSSTTSTCTANASEVGAISYGLVATNGSGAGAPANLSLNWQIAAGAAPTCTVSASTATPQLGSLLTLSGNCSHTPTKFEWLGCSALLTEVCNALSECSNATTACSPIGSQVGAIYYALRASNSAGASAKAGVGVTWQAAAGPTPPPPASPVPQCTVSASHPTPAVGTTLTLTANCSNSPTIYAWTNCSSTTNVCTTTEASAVMRIYSVTASNAAGTGPPAAATVTWQQPPTAPPVCTLTATNTSPMIGTSITLTANCTQSPTSYSWVGCTGAMGNQCLTSSANVGAITYSVTATNAIGTGAAASVAVNWQALPPPPPPGAGDCSAFSDVLRMTMPWTSGATATTYTEGGMRAGTVLALAFTVSASATGQGSIEGVEFPDAPYERVTTLAAQPCDFRGFVPGAMQFPPGDPTGVNGPLAYVGGNVPSFQFILQGTPQTFPPKPVLIPGRTYYFNVRTIRASDGANACTGPTCNLKIVLRTQ